MILNTKYVSVANNSNTIIILPALLIKVFGIISKISGIAKGKTVNINNLHIAFRFSHHLPDNMAHHPVSTLMKIPLK